MLTVDRSTLSISYLFCCDVKIAGLENLTDILRRVFPAYVAALAQYTALTSTNAQSSKVGA